MMQCYLLKRSRKKQHNTILYSHSAETGDSKCTLWVILTVQKTFKCESFNLPIKNLSHIGLYYTSCNCSSAYLMSFLQTSEIKLLYISCAVRYIFYGFTANHSKWSNTLFCQRLKGFTYHVILHQNAP